MAVAPGACIVVRRRVTVGGRVADADGLPACGGELSLTALPAGSTAPANAFARRHVTSIRRDGFYFFLDIPPGRYEIEGRDQRGIATQTRDVVLADAPGARPLLGVNVVVPVRETGRR